MRKNIVAGNWKMNKTLQEGIALAKELNETLANEKPNCDVIICTPFIHLASVTPLVDAAKIGVGAENCADKESGAYTGEVSEMCIRDRPYTPHFTDDASVVEALGVSVFLTPGNRENIKITTPFDFTIATALIGSCSI